MARGMGLCCCFIVVVMALPKGATAAQTYLVGDSFGWKVPPNSSYYTIWASKRIFYVGDKLTFNWTGSHTVGISHIQAEYDNCTRDPGEVLNSLGPGVIVPLGTSGSFYFYCTVDDHCGSGQKSAINALTNGSEPPSPSSASSFTIGAFVAAVVSTIVITVLIYD
ncbi:umecyanin-like [Quercus robur]|uniref:umecyanin-like n=1 Tax=Quercus robur TaxID=38942 RepID=UPI002161562A|nr:umecyanin-like [Quercus robur]